MKTSVLIAALALFTIGLAGVPAASSRAADAQSPLGLWKTVDDKTGMPRAMVRIYLQDGKYFGRIEQSFAPGAETRVCSVCTDERHRLRVSLQVSSGQGRDGSGGTRLHRYFAARPNADLAAAKLSSGACQTGS